MRLNSVLAALQQQALAGWHDDLNTNKYPPRALLPALFVHAHSPQDLMLMERLPMVVRSVVQSVLAGVSTAA